MKCEDADKKTPEMANEASHGRNLRSSLPYVKGFEEAPGKGHRRSVESYDREGRGSQWE